MNGNGLTKKHTNHQLSVRYFSFVPAESSLSNFLFLTSTFVILLGLTVGLDEH
jgi:hypothetical protein